MGPMAMVTGNTTLASAVWPTGNTAFLYPIRLTKRRTFVRAAVCNGATAAGTWDIGVYTLGGSRVGSVGSAQTQTGINQMQVATCNFSVDPGTYLMALVMSINTATVFRSQPTSGLCQAFGCKQVATSIPLPSSVTLSALATGFLPLFGLCEKTWL